MLTQFLPSGTELLYADTIDSTNRAAKERARGGAPHGACVIASRQTAGRGRLGRAFHSPDGGIYMSVILHSAADAGMLTTLAAVAVRGAVKGQLGLDTSIKWVNDLLLDGRKVCGILTEGVVMDGRRLAAVVGIGINVYAGAFPDDIMDKAGALLNVPPAPGVNEQLAGAVVTALLDGLLRVPQHMQAYRAHCLTLGKHVRYTQGTAQGEGIAHSITDLGALVIRTPGGEMVTLEAGEAQVRMPDGGYL